MTRLSKNFTLEELCYSDTARAKGIPNIPTTEITKNLGALVQNVLQPLREKLNKPILITSGYRGKLLNKAVGGADNSQHTRGQAVDIQVIGMTPEELYNYLKASDIVYDQLILEITKSAKWVHISYCTKLNRQQNLIYKNNRYLLDVN